MLDLWRGQDPFECDQVAQVSREVQETIREHLDVLGDGIRLEETMEFLPECQVALLWVARYTEPAEMVPRFCDHAAQIIMLQKEVTELKAQHFLPPMCDHSELDKKRQTLVN